MRLALILCATLAPTPGLACDGEVILSCTAKAGATAIEVCLAGGSFTYAYGPVGRPPELTLREPLTNGTLYPWQGFGRAIAESIIFPNGPFRYEVSYALDRLDADHPADGSVRVTRNDREIAFIPCDAGSASLGLFAAQDAMAAIGQCWDGPSEQWTTACP